MFIRVSIEIITTFYTYSKALYGQRRVRKQTRNLFCGRGNGIRLFSSVVASISTFRFSWFTRLCREFG